MNLKTGLIKKFVVVGVVFFVIFKIVQIVRAIKSEKNNKNIDEEIIDMM